MDFPFDAFDKALKVAKEKTTSSNSGALKSFISESQIEEANKRKKEEWTKNRKDDDPLEPPEEEYDPRSLFDRLQEEKRKKEDEKAELMDIKNVVRGLDSEETAFLRKVSRDYDAKEMMKIREEREIIMQMKSRITHITEPKELLATSNHGKSTSKPTVNLLSAQKRKSAAIPDLIVKKKHVDSKEKSKSQHMASVKKSEVPVLSPLQSLCDYSDSDKSS